MLMSSRIFRVMDARTEFQVVTVRPFSPRSILHQLGDAAAGPTCPPPIPFSDTPVARP
jgi:hypothetical protein